MSEEILINVSLKEVRVASLINNTLQELMIERKNQPNLVGNIYKAKVNRLVDGMEAAFVDIGWERSAFLPRPANQVNLKEGQEILVQVYKDKLGTKGPRVSTELSIPSRFLVLTPHLQQPQVSQKISDPTERERLISLLKPSAFTGYLFRTAANNASQAEIFTDQRYLEKLWEEIQSSAKAKKVGDLVYQDQPLELRILRDWTPKIKKIRVDDKATFEKMQRYIATFLPNQQLSLEYYSAKLPIFDLYSLEEEIKKLLMRQVYLKSGGYLVIDQTEAMVTIDVNTGSFLGKMDLERTAFQINQEAVEAIARQIRLRNLSGIIIVDFIDMTDTAHRQSILKSLLTAVAKDPVRVEVRELSSLGLVQIIRKRVRKSLDRALCDPCPTCQKRGTIKSVQTVCYEICNIINQLDAHEVSSGYMIKASPEVILALENEEKDQVVELEKKLSKAIKLQSEVSFGREQYGILVL